ATTEIYTLSLHDALPIFDTPSSASCTTIILSRKVKKLDRFERWYLRYSLSLRDVEELLEERGLNVDHTTVWRWVQYYGSELEQRLRQHLKPTNKSWRVDETYVRVKGRWCY